MRFMVMHKVDANMEAGGPPSQQIIASMGALSTAPEIRVIPALSAPESDAVLGQVSPARLQGAARQKRRKPGLQSELSRAPRGRATELVYRSPRGAEPSSERRANLAKLIQSLKDEGVSILADNLAPSSKGARLTGEKRQAKLVGWSVH